MASRKAIRLSNSVAGIVAPPIAIPRPGIPPNCDEL